MATLRFVDNTVLINYTLIDRHDLLVWFMQGQGAWCLSISREAAASGKRRGLERMADWHVVLGTPLVPDQLEMLDARSIAGQMLKPGENQRSAHMGEAETLAIISRRGLAALFLTDDHDAARAAQFNGVPTVSTSRILAHAVVAGHLEQGSAKRLLADLLNARRVMGNPPSPAQFDGFVRDLSERRRPT